MQGGRSKLVELAVSLVKRAEAVLSCFGKRLENSRSHVLFCYTDKQLFRSRSFVCNWQVCRAGYRNVFQVGVFTELQRVDNNRPFSIDMSSLFALQAVLT